MRRRNFVGVLGSCLVGGCSSIGDQVTPTSTTARTDTRTETPTPTASPTRTPEPAPRIQAFEPITKAADFSTLDEYETSGFGVGMSPIFGIEHEVPVFRGNYGYELELRILEGDEELDSYTTDLYHGAENSRNSVHRQDWVRINPDPDLTTGSYTGEISVRNNFNDRVATAETTFEVNELLDDGEVELVRAEPNEVYIGELVEFTAVIKNTSNRDSSVISAISSRYGLNEPNDLDQEVRLNIPAGDEMEFTHAVGRLKNLAPRGSYTLTLEDVDVEIHFLVVSDDSESSGQ